MKYFNDLKVLEVNIINKYRCVLDVKAEGWYSLEFIGEGKMFFQEGEGRRYLIDYPALRWQMKGVRYRYGALEPNGWGHYYVLFKGTRAKKLCEDGFAPLSKKGFIRIHRPEIFKRHYMKMCDMLYKEKGAERFERLSFMLEEMLFICMEDRKKLELKNPLEEKFERLCRSMHEKAHEDFDFQRIASEMGKSYSHFRKLFMEYSGMPPHRYLLNERLNAASLKLREGASTPLKTIAFDMNLGDTAQFSKAFKSKFGIAPSEYRKNLIY